MHFISFAASVLLSTAIVARGSPIPLDRRAGVTFHILTAGDEACDDGQVAAIKAAITDAKLMASGALEALAVQGVQKSNGYKHLLGDAPVASVKERFNFVNNLDIPATVTSLDAFRGKTNDLVFTGIPATAAKSGVAYANTVNIGHPTKQDNGVNPTVNLIRFAPAGLAAHESFKVAAAKIKAAGGEMKANAFQTFGKIPAPPTAFILVHEVQHSFPMFGNDEEKHLADQHTAAGKAATGINQVQTLTDAQKPLNPQNYTFFALYVCHSSSRPLPRRARNFSRPVASSLVLNWEVSRAPSLVLRSLVERVIKAKPTATAPVKASKPAAVKPSAAPVAKPVAPPAANPAAPAKPAAPPAAKPVVPAKAAIPPAAKPIAAAKPAAPPAAKPVVATKPAPPPTTNPVVAAKPAAPPAAKPPTAAAAPFTSCPNLKNGIPGVDLPFAFDGDE
ncbi:hypothetical protein FB45DRAFT_1039731 [Roridomyces roridus]|uniref:Uncharacterized protein n=1 Tax=Roridomyces roridus TaxID=1738132 RepID=A0AAD7B323_9AGAR|nr:hypothetical protein FB45DRAFT_1039731 [Roridomyces roridus]